MFCKLFEARHPGLLPLLMLIVIMMNRYFVSLVDAAKKSGSGVFKSPQQMPKEHIKDLTKINELSYKTPFRYHYTPWITRKLLLTMNMTSTNVQYFSLEQLNTVTSKDLDYESNCDHPSIIRKIQDPKKKKPDIRPSIDIDDFKDVKDLTCQERMFLHNFAVELNKTSHWSNCTQIDKNSIHEICEQAEKLKKISNKETAHEELKSILNNYSLKYCSKFVLKDVISKVNRERILGLKDYNGNCENIMGELVQLDVLVNTFSCEFDEILSRIYCQGYSVKETCDECSNAYKQWLCSMTIPYHVEDLVIKPCLSICQRVERTCPYLHPEMKDQYGGEPIFICNDPDIPVAKDAEDEPYGLDRACFQKCHLEANHTLTMKSLLMKNDSNATEESKDSDNESALIENPDLEVCIPIEKIMNNTKRYIEERLVRKNQTFLYEDNETIDQRMKLENKTKNEISNQSKRDLFAKWSTEDGMSSARMVDQIELEEERIVEEVKETVGNLEHEKHYVDDIYYLDSNSSQTNEENNQTNRTTDEEPKISKPTFTVDRDAKFHLDQRQETFSHFSEDDENDNEDGDSDLDQVISTTTITSLNYAANKQTNHLDKKQ